MDLTWSGHDRTCAKCEQCVDGKWSQHGQDVDRLHMGLAWIITLVAGRTLPSREGAAKVVYS